MDRSGLPVEEPPDLLRLGLQGGRAVLEVVLLDVGVFELGVAVVDLDLARDVRLRELALDVRSQHPALCERGLEQGGGALAYPRRRPHALALQDLRRRA